MDHADHTTEATVEFDVVDEPSETGASADSSTGGDPSSESSGGVSGTGGDASTGAGPAGDTGGQAESQGEDAGTGTDTSALDDGPGGSGCSVGGTGRGGLPLLFLSVCGLWVRRRKN